VGSTKTRARARVVRGGERVAQGKCVGVRARAWGGGAAECRRARAPKGGGRARSGPFPRSLGCLSCSSLLSREGGGACLRLRLPPPSAAALRPLAARRPLQRGVGVGCNSCPPQLSILLSSHLDVLLARRFSRVLAGACSFDGALIELWRHLLPLSLSVLSPLKFNCPARPPISVRPRGRVLIWTGAD
jgi:hypothetical protein